MSDSDAEPSSLPASEVEFPGASRVAAANLLANRLNLPPSPFPSPYSEGPMSQMSDTGGVDFRAFGEVPRATEMGAASADPDETRGEKRVVEDDTGGVAKAVDDKQSFIYVGKYPSSEDGSVVFGDDAVDEDGASSSAASYSGAATSSGSFGSAMSNATLSDFNSEASSRGQAPPHFDAKEEKEIDGNIHNLLRDGGGRFASAYDSEMSGVNSELLEILGIIKNCGKAGVRVAFKSAVFAGENLYKILAFATASKLNLIIVLGICGTLYNNCPYAAYVFDFLISRTLPIIKFLGRVTGFNAGIVNLFNGLKNALGIDELINLLASIKAAIPTAEQIQEIIDQAVRETADAAKEAAKGVAGMTAAGIARDRIIDAMFNRVVETATPGIAERLLNVAVSGAANGLSQVGIRSLIETALSASNPTFAALQNGAGRKKRRRTMRQKKRSQTKRRVKHGKRRQTKKRQNKRTKTRSKQ
jgi:hypothetical protein